MNTANKNSILETDICHGCYLPFQHECHSPRYTLQARVRCETTSLLCRVVNTRSTARHFTPNY